MLQVDVTNSVISIETRAYQVRNITSIAKSKVNPRYMINGLLFLISIALTAMGFFVGISDEYIGFFNWLNIIFGVLSGIGIWERKTKKLIYGVEIETNAGNTRYIASRNESSIDEIIDTIFQVMKNQDATVNSTFKIEGDLINQTGLFQKGIQM